MKAQKGTRMVSISRGFVLSTFVTTLVSFGMSTWLLAAEGSVLHSMDIPLNVSSDTIVIKVDGILPNSCYNISKIEHAMVTDDDGSPAIDIGANTFVSPGYCLQFIRPVTESIVFKDLEPGSYKVRLFEDNRLLIEKQMTVFESHEVDPSE